MTVRKSTPGPHAHCDVATAASLTLRLARALGRRPWRLIDNPPLVRLVDRFDRVDGNFDAPARRAYRIRLECTALKRSPGWSLGHPMKRCRSGFPVFPGTEAPATWAEPSVCPVESVCPMGVLQTVSCISAGRGLKSAPWPTRMKKLHSVEPSLTAIPGSNSVRGPAQSGLLFAVSAFGVGAKLWHGHCYCLHELSF